MKTSQSNKLQPITLFVLREKRMTIYREKKMLTQHQEHNKYLVHIEVEKTV